MKGHIRARDRRKIAGAKTPCRRWQLVVDDLRGEGGGRNQRYRSFEGSKSDAERALRRFIDELETGFASESDAATVGEYMKRWLEHAATQVRPRSLTSYKQLTEMHIVPYVGALKLHELRPMHLQSLYTRLLESGRRTKNGGRLSENSVVHVHRVLYSALRQAVRWRLVSVNVADAVSPPRIRRLEMRALSGPEVQILLSAAQGTRLYEVILLAVVTGMRRGEILGLKWSDISLSEARVTVNRALQPDRSLAEPKTARSRREISLPRTAIDALRQHKAKQNEWRLALGAGYHDQDFVFTSESGDLWWPDGISTLYRSIVTRSGVGTLRFHDLRHTAASLLIEKGAPITTVAQILGHANTSTTLSLYAHAIKGSERIAAGIMESVLQGEATLR